MIAAFVGLLLLYAGQTVAWAQAASDPAVMADTGSTPPADAAQPVDPQLGQVESDNRLAQAEMLDLRRRLGAAEATGRWLPWLMLAVVAMVAMSAWLGLRVRRLQHEKSRRDSAISHSELQSSRSMDGVSRAQQPLRGKGAGTVSRARKLLSFAMGSNGGSQRRCSWKCMLARGSYRASHATACAVSRRPA